MGRQGRVGGSPPQGPVPVLAGLMDGNGCSIGTHILSYKPIMLEKYWIKCPICNGKTRVQVFYNTVLRNFPLFCPKCKLTHIIDVEKLEIIIKNSEKQKEGY